MERTKRNFIILLALSILVCVIGICIFSTAEQTTWFGNSVIDKEQQKAGLILVLIGGIGFIVSFIYKANYNKKKALRKLTEKESITEVSDTLEKIKKLYKDGEITESEYKKRKEIILKRL